MVELYTVGWTLIRHFRLRINLLTDHTHPNPSLVNKTCHRSQSMSHKVILLDFYLRSADITLSILIWISSHVLKSWQVTWLPQSRDVSLTAIVQENLSETDSNRIKSIISLAEQCHCGAIIEGVVALFQNKPRVNQRELRRALSIMPRFENIYFR